MSLIAITLAGLRAESPLLIAGLEQETMASAKARIEIFVDLIFIVFLILIIIE